MKLTKILENIGVVSCFLGVMWAYGFVENKVEEAVKDGYKMCQTCWDRLPERVVREITHLS